MVIVKRCTFLFPLLLVLLIGWFVFSIYRRQLSSSTSTNASPNTVSHTAFKPLSSSARYDLNMNDELQLFPLAEFNNEQIAQTAILTREVLRARIPELIQATPNSGLFIQSS